jgi:reductive dehalogenase
MRAGEREQKTDQPPQDKDIVFADVDVPEVTDTKFVIPRKMKWVVAIAIPMDIELLARTPTPLGDAASALGYSHSAFVVSSLAVFIRGLGYEAIPCVNDTAQSIPFALDAGLGELSRLNKLVTPNSAQRFACARSLPICRWHTTSLFDFGLVEFCKTCKKCAEACPSRALSFDDEPSFKTRGPWNNPDTKPGLRTLTSVTNTGRSRVRRAASVLRVARTRRAIRHGFTKAVKATISIAPAADGVFRIMDNAFGYGKQHDPEQWWTKDRRPAGEDDHDKQRRCFHDHNAQARPGGFGFSPDYGFNWKSCAGADGIGQSRGNPSTARPPSVGLPLLSGRRRRLWLAAPGRLTNPGRAE